MSRAFSLIWLIPFLLQTACASQYPSVAPARSAAATPFASPGPVATQQPENCTDLVPTESTFGVRNWPATDFCRHSVPYEEIDGILGKDKIVALDNPRFESIEEAGTWLTNPEPVLAFETEDEAKAYPLSVLIWHEIVNDEVGGVAVAVTYCPLCNSALVFDRRVDGRVLSFGATGNLRNADLIMYDRETESWWQQFEGEAIVGDLTGARLAILPSRLVSFGDFREQYPDGRILSPNTGFDRNYGENPYINYDSLANSSTKYFRGETDPRLPPKRRVLAITLANSAVAYPYDILMERQVINDTRDGRSLVIFWKSGTVSPLYNQYIFDSNKDIGSAAAFSRLINDQLLTFEPVPEDISLFEDIETGSHWNFFGTAVDGPLTGQRLSPITSNEFFWFAWAAFRPDSELYEGS